MKRRGSRFLPSQGRSRAPDFCAVASSLGKQKMWAMRKDTLVPRPDDVWWHSPLFITKPLPHSTVLLLACITELREQQRGSTRKTTLRYQHT